MENKDAESGIDKTLNYQLPILHFE